MRQTKWTQLILALLACAFISVAAVRAEDAPPTPPAGGGGGRGNFDPAKMREMMQTRLKEQMGATDDEWKALQPKVEELQKAQEATRGSMRSLFRGNRGGNTPPADDANKTDIQRKTEALKALVDAKDSDPKAIQDALKALRDEREKNKATTKKAQDSLKELLTAKQEAILVMYGMLE
jgi:Spy/CpxP family protein refolding chaperone